ncbi:MAG: hypothetical protein ACI4LX_06485 [Treponema sp.]
MKKVLKGCGALILGAVLSWQGFCDSNVQAEKTADGAEAKGRSWSMQVGAKGDRRVKVETDPYIVSVIDEGKEKFVQAVFTDTNGTQLEYSLFVPENHSGKKLPLVMFIADASSVSKSAREIVEQYFGADIWVSDSVQKKNPCVVLVPAFPVLATDDDWNTSVEVESVIPLVNEIAKKYDVDTDRIYTTGQSMGCMISLYLNSKNPGFFAASLFVSGQWNIDVLESLKDEKFFYITAGGDAMASGGQSAVMEMLKKNSVPYSFGTWSAKEYEAGQNRRAKKLIAKKKNINFIRFEKGTVLSDTERFEHNASFNYGYKIEAVRDWLFMQKK